MNTLRITLALVTALAATAAFAGPRGKSTVSPAGSAAYRTGPAVAVENDTMIEKSGKRTSTVSCDGATAQCKAHCSK